MQLPGIARCIPPVEIVDPVGDVRTLLDLDDEGPLSDAVHPSCRQIKDVARCDCLATQNVGQCIVGNATFVLRRVDRAGESGQ